MNELKQRKIVLHQLELIDAVRDDARSALAKLLPIGSRVQVKLKSGQTNLTKATVTGIPTYRDGYVKVEIDTAKERSRQKYRDVHISRIDLIEVQP